MDDTKVYRSDCILDTWVQSNSRKRGVAKDMHVQFISLEKRVTLMMTHLKDDPDIIRKFVEEYKKTSMRRYYRL